MSTENQSLELFTVVLLRHMRPILDMLRYAVLNTPEEAFAGSGIEVREHLYHSMVGMDIWLSHRPEDYPLSDVTDLLAAQLQKAAPNAISRRFLLAYVGKLEARVDALPATLEGLLEKRQINGGEITILDQCLMQVRHVQHHLGAVDEILRRKGFPVVDWYGYGGGYAPPRLETAAAA